MTRLTAWFALLLTAAAQGAPLTVRFFDVGQGDAALVTTPLGKTVLIDGGPPDAGPRLTSRVRALTQGPLDLVVLSHAHLDHLGGLTDVLRAVGARRYLEPDFDHPSTAYLSFLRFLGTLEVTKLPTGDPTQPLVPVRYPLEPEVELTLLWPRVDGEGKPLEPFLGNTRSDVNANSVVARLTYRKTSFLFVGDAEADTEALLVKKNLPLASTVLKVAHHGSRHSSTASFLEKVKPTAAVISCAAKNDYGHPAAETLVRLSAAGAKVYRTDLHGEVTALSDGEVVRLRTERAGVVPASPTSTQGPYVASKRSQVFHLASCAAVATIKPHNRLEFSERTAAAKERRPAGDCRP
ncbi:MAG: ComEC/Rec2 family competence protein [Myxococcota bacterium]